MKVGKVLLQLNLWCPDDREGQGTKMRGGEKIKCLALLCLQVVYEILGILHQTWQLNGFPEA